jgi:hypothetical protein
MIRLIQTLLVCATVLVVAHWWKEVEVMYVELAVYDRAAASMPAPSCTTDWDCEQKYGSAY